jgi:hypothetical protein
MRIASALSAGQFGRRPLIVFGPLLIGAFAAYQLVQYVLGTTALGGQCVARFFNVKPPVIVVDRGFGTLVVEMGIGGLVLWIVMSMAILFSAWKILNKLKGSPWLPLGFVVFLYSFFSLIPATFGGMVAYEDFLLNACFWLPLGLLLRLPTIALSAQFAVNAPVALPARRWMR